MVAKEALSPDKKLHSRDPLTTLEKELDEVVSCCKSFIGADPKITRKKNNKKQPLEKDKRLELKNESTVTLEKVRLRNFIRTYIILFN